MSNVRRKRRTPPNRRAILFAALGDDTRLALIGQLSNGTPQSISRLAEQSTLTRQAITKHLRVLEDAGVVHSNRQGRESVFAFTPEPLTELRSYLEQLSQQWDFALARLKSFVEE